MILREGELAGKICGIPEVWYIVSIELNNN